jgi:cytochrome oxidase Cu insertion factor (SCO1/SenC/PrrC family)
MRLLPLLVCLLLIGTSCDSSETKPSVPPASAEPDAASVGKAPAPPAGSRMAVGQRAPSFRLKDQHGQEQSLEQLLAKGNVALVFYRSADW